MVRNGIHPDHYVYNILICAYAKQEKVEEAMLVFSKMRQQGLNPNAVTYGTVIGILCKSGRVEDAMQKVDEAMLVFSKMRQQGLNPDTVTYGTVIDVLCKSGRVEDAMRYFEQMIDERLSPGNIVYNSLIHSLCIFDKWDKAKELILEMLDRGICLDTIFFNSIIDSHCKEGRVIESEKLFDLMSGRVEDAMRYFEQMIDERLTPGNIVYTSLIHGLCTYDKWEKAEERTAAAKELYVGITKSGTQLELSTYNIILHGLCKNKLTDDALRICMEARKIFDSMTKRGLKPDITTYGTLLQGYATKGALFDMHALLDLMGYATKGALVEMHALLDLMVRNGIQPDHHVFNILICAYAKQEKVDQAMLGEEAARGAVAPRTHATPAAAVSRYNRMTRAGADEVTPDLCTYGILIGCCCRAGRLDLGKMDEAMKLLSGMVSVGLKPNTVTYSTLINGYCKISRMEDALVLFKEMESSGVSPDIITYNIILQGLFQTRRTAAAKELYVRITESGTQIELSTYNIILHGLCKNKLTDDALRINDEAKDLFVAFSSNGLVPNYWTYRLMAENIIGQGLLEELDQLFLSMEDNGCTVDSGMLNFIVRELLQRGEITRAGTYLSMIDEKHFSLEASTASFPIRGGIFSVCVNSEVQTGACGQVKEVGKNASEERLIVVSSQEIPDDPVSPTIEALILLHSKVSTLAENHQLTTRLVVPSNKVGCILGEGGKVITEMRRRTGAEIRVYSKADKPKYLSFDEELVQVAGLPAIERGALTEIASRL
uniref:K Homology domain-containing protein n=1 Tax=Oryza rufipogon TaxID=4529 RepID=A0A0E0R0X8_ORYRU